MIFRNPLLNLGRLPSYVRLCAISNIGANLTDPMFQGIYGSSQKHPSDLDIVLQRSWTIGMQKMLITVGSLNEVNNALDISKKDARLFVTIGCHPTRCGEFEPNPEKYFSDLSKAIEQNSEKVVAVGECGLDYDRLHFCEKDIQKKYFEKQLELAEKYKLPLFLHCRNSHDDFFEILSRNKEKCSAGGVVHSFDGTISEAEKIIEMGFFIGINGCSLKTEENLNVVKDIPKEKILIETDCPWCGIRNTHASSKYIQTKFPTVKKKEKWSSESLIDGRNEPCQIIQVLEVLAALKEEPIEELGELIYKNTNDLFLF